MFGVRFGRIRVTWNRFAQHHPAFCSLQTFSDTEISDYHKGFEAAFIVTFLRHLNSAQDGRLGTKCPAGRTWFLLAGVQSPKIFLVEFPMGYSGSVLYFADGQRSVRKTGSCAFPAYCLKPCSTVTHLLGQLLLSLSASPPHHGPRYGLLLTPHPTSPWTSPPPLLAAVVDSQSPSMCLIERELLNGKMASSWA